MQKLKSSIKNLAKHAGTEEVSQKETAPKFREIFNNINDAMYYHALQDNGMSGTFLEVNRKACDMLGYSRDELLCMKPQDLDTGGEQKNSPSIMSKLLKDGAATFEMEHQAKDGSKIPVEVSSHLFTTNGERRVLSIARNIAERKRAEEALRQSEEKYRCMFECSPEAIVLLDTEGTVLDVNERLEEWLGYKPDEVIGVNLLGLPYLPPHSKHKVKKHFTERMTGIDVRPYELEFLSRNNERRIGLIHATPLTDAKGNIYADLVLIRDITGYKQKQQALAESEERYRRLFEAAQDGILILEAETGEIVDANPSLKEILGYRKDELVGRQLWQVGAFRHIAENKESFRELVRGGYIRHENLPMKTKNRGEAAVEFISNIYAVDGKNVVQCNIRDVTQRQLAERELRQTVGELQRTKQQVIEQERQRALTTMASGIAHAFNNALSPIRGFSEMLLDNPEMLKDQEKLTTYLGYIHKAAGNAAETIRSMRKFYRPQEKTSLTALDLNDVITEAVVMTEPRWRGEARAAGKEIEVQTEFDNIPNVAGNEAELNDLITNLIFNAVDAMPKGGRITISTKMRDEQQISFQISDNGTGMSRETRQKCLDPFYTEKGAEGSGLGLATVQGVVRRHSGELSIASTEGEGTTLYITLPVAESTAEPPGHKLKQSDLLKILVVEDQEEQRELLRHMLTAQGHQTEMASNGIEGIEKFNIGWFDLVITDRSMPEMSGDALAAEVKRTAPGKPVIMLTGFGDMMDAAGENPSSVDAVIGKPTSSKKLQETISRVMAAELSR